MDKQLLEKAFLKLNEKEKNIIKTGFNKLDDVVSYCGYGSIITFAGTLNTELFINLLRKFLADGKKCLYFIEEYKRENFVKNLMLLSATFENNSLDVTKNKMLDWDLEFYDKKLQDINELEKFIETEKPDYIFVDNISNFKIKSLPSDYENSIADFLSKYLKIYCAKYSSISFIKSGEMILEDVDMDLISSDELKKVSDVTIAAKFDNYSDNICTFWILKNNITDVGVFSLKYEYKTFKFFNIELPDKI